MSGGFAAPRQPKHRPNVPTDLDETEKGPSARELAQRESDRVVVAAMLAREFKSEPEFALMLGLAVTL